MQKKDYSWNTSTCIREDSKYLKIIGNTSVIKFDEIRSFNDVSAKLTNTIATNVTKNCCSKKVRDCYILCTGLLVITLLLIITITCYHYAKRKGINALTI